jgi:transcriptional regulator with XRE-family HTH domain
MIELKNAVNEAKIKLGLSNSELSKLIGYSRNYISETLRIGASTEKQAEVIGKIKEAVAVELVSRGVCGVSSPIERSQDVTSDFVRKDYHEQEVAKLRAALVFSKAPEEHAQKIKNLSNDLAISSRDKNFMKKKLQDKNAVINWLMASNVFFILFLVAKCVGWV